MTKKAIEQVNKYTRIYNIFQIFTYLFSTAEIGALFHVASIEMKLKYFTFIFSTVVY